MSIIEHYKSLQRYEAWANARSIESIESVPAISRGAMQHTRALQVMSHSQIARTVWLSRLQGKVERVSDWFPPWTIAEIREKAGGQDRDWESFLGTVTEPDIARAVRYTSSEGVAYESTVGEIITHVYNHSTYHRGQVARLVTEAGGKRASTDFIALTRRTL